MHMREAVEADARAMARVHVESWRTTYRGIVPDDYLASLSVDEREGRWQRILAYPGESRSFVSEDNADAIFGFASGGPDRDGDPDFAGELWSIYLLASHQHRGAGAALVARVAEDLIERGLRSMLVWVLAENPYRRFYEKLGGPRGQAAGHYHQWQVAGRGGLRLG